MNGRVEIVNLALARLGESPIQSLDEGSVAANSATLLYGPARKAVLRDYNWNFAITTASLAQLDVTPVGFRFAFALPSDCIRALRITGQSQYCDARYEGNLTIRRGVLYSDVENPTLEYIGDVEDEALFDAKFIEAFSYKLASELAMPIKGSSELMASYANVYQALVSQAAAESGREERNPVSDNPYVEARNGGY